MVLFPLVSVVITTGPCPQTLLLPNVSIRSRAMAERIVVDICWANPSVCSYVVLISLVLLFQRVLLSYCQLFLDAATVGTDHVDATDTDVGIDGFAWLDGEGSDGETTHVDDAYISFTT